jgi:hypothetical protein
MHVSVYAQEAQPLMWDGNHWWTGCNIIIMHRYARCVYVMSCVNMGKKPWW